MLQRAVHVLAEGSTEYTTGAQANGQASLWRCTAQSFCVVAAQHCKAAALILLHHCVIAVTVWANLREGCYVLKGMFVISPQLKLLYVNSWLTLTLGLCGLLSQCAAFIVRCSGYSPQAPHSRFAMDLIHPDLQSKVPL